MRLTLALASLMVAAGAFAAGRQLSGVYTPAQTPALKPEDAAGKFSVPEGFEVRIFAYEPDVINPVGMSWDERGRLWVAELYEYPLGAKAGEKPRDRIKILEDTDADGRADKVTVFADGFNLLSGILVGNGGVYVGQAPDFLFLEDTDGDDKADQRTVLKTGFGLHDRHELLNGFTWGPDGWLYMTHGVFTHSKVKDPNDPNDDGVKVDAAVARYHPRTKKFEVFADGTSNPWGVDFDREGNAFISACVIDHLFHVTAGGLYVRQGGTPPNPFVYGLLPSIVDHKHFRAAYAGAQVYQGHMYPGEYKGTIMMGNIHQSAINHDTLTKVGSSFRASANKDFLVADDGWFRPVSTQVGPDGALWVMDWYDKYPCYQNANADPEGVDREHGRIWRVVYTGDKKGAAVPSRTAREMNLTKASTAELVELLSHANVWHRRVAQRLLNERRDTAAKSGLVRLLENGKTLEARLAALWTLHGTELLDEATLDQYATDKDAPVRTWVARLTGERRQPSEASFDRLKKLAADSDASVRLAVATACRQYSSGSLTVNTPVPDDIENFKAGAILETIVRNSADAKDPLIPFMVWMASEPRLAENPKYALAWLVENGPDTMPLSGQLALKTMRRISDLRSVEEMNDVVEFLEKLTSKHSDLALAALDGLIQGAKGSKPPSVATGPVLEKLNYSPQLTERAQRLGALWGDAVATERLLARLTDPEAPEAEKIRAIQSARQLRTDPARDALVRVLNSTDKETILTETIRALGEVGGDDVAEQILERWPALSPAARRTAAEVLVSRNPWATALLKSVEQKKIEATDISAGAVRSLSQHSSASIRERAAQLVGRYRATDADKLKLIGEKRKAVLTGTPDLKAGYEVAQKTCFVCHKLHGEGADVGPDLTGVGRSTLDALLANIIDPNQVVGKGYENVEVETKDGRTVSGRLVEDTDTRVKLLASGPKEEIVAKSDVANRRISELSVMPEGLEQMPDEDFRNMVWYILNPPQDNRPMTPALRRELIGEEAPQKRASQPVDGESVALWNPEWRVLAPEFEGTPRKLPDFEGRKNVLVTHPVDRDTASGIERSIAVPREGKTVLSFYAAAHEKGDWQLRVLADGKRVHVQTIDKPGDRWKHVSVDLSQFAGRTIGLRLENAPNDWSYEFAYWSDVNVNTTPSAEK
jgi:putative membrane-bound dehydrogenase-like protein